VPEPRGTLRVAGLSGYGAANGRLNPVIKTRKGERRNNKEMNTKILASVLVIGMLALAMGYGTYAYFSNTKTSTNNTFTAGTINLQLKDADEDWRDGVTATWSVSGWVPGDSFIAELDMRNTGTTGALVGRIKGIDLTETDANGVWTDIADYIYITDIEYTENGVWQPYNLTDYYAGIMGNTAKPLTLREFCASGGYSMVFWTGAGNPGASGIDYFPAGGTVVEGLKLGFTFDSAAGNPYQGDSATFTLRVTADDDPTILGKGGPCYGY
jgi:predicted ribosomally synthesized peptide with SipW-like signal peptide